MNPYDDLKRIIMSFGDLKEVYDDEVLETEIGASPFAIMSTPTGDFERLGRYVFALTTDLDVHVVAPVGWTHSQLTDLRRKLITHILADDTGLEWHPASYERSRIVSEGDTPLVEKITFQLIDDEITYR